MKKTLIAIALLFVVAGMISCGRDNEVPVTSSWTLHLVPSTLAATSWGYHLDTVVVEDSVEIGYSYNHRLSFYDDTTGQLLWQVRVAVTGEEADSIVEPLPLRYHIDNHGEGMLQMTTQSLVTAADTTLTFPFRYQQGTLLVDDNLQFFLEP